jgi:hypothetical protein
MEMRKGHTSCWTLKKEALNSVETSVTIYQSTQCDILEHLDLQQHFPFNLKLWLDFLVNVPFSKDTPFYPVGYVTPTYRTGGKGDKFLRSALIYDLTQHRVVIIYRRFGTTYGPIFKSQEVKY